MLQVKVCLHVTRHFKDALLCCLITKRTGYERSRSFLKQADQIGRTEEGGEWGRECRGMKRSCAKHLVSALSHSPQKFQHNMFFFQPFGFACCIFSAPPSLMYGKDLCLGKITGTGLCFPREGSNGCTSLLCCGKGSVTLRSRELIKFHSQCGEEECRTEAHSTGQQSTAQYSKKPRNDAPHGKAQYNRAKRHTEMHNKSKHNARTVQTR